MSNPSTSDEPVAGCLFAVEVDGIQQGLFTRASGLSSRSDVYEIREGGRNDGVLRFRGQGRWGNLVLQGAIATSPALFEWRMDALEGRDGFRRDGALVLLDAALEEVRRWEFREGWPVVWEGPEMDGGKSDLAVEKLEIAHHGLEER